jgi:AcrR family transcriptional regulator
MNKLQENLSGLGISPKQYELVNTAYKLFRRHGFQRVSVEEVCRLAGVSKVTFYKYFSGKDELILFIVRSLFDAMLARSGEILASPAEITEKFDDISLLKQSLMAEVGDEMTRAILTHPAAKEYLLDIYQRSADMFREFVAREQRLGNINPTVNVELILALMLELNRMYSENRLEGIFSGVEDMIRQVNELLLKGMLAREEAK